MPDDGATRYRDDLLIETFATLFRFDELAEAVPQWNPYPPYLFYGVWILFDVAILNVYKQLTGGTHALLADPFWITTPLGLVVATIGIRYMADEYADAISQLRISDRIDDSDADRFASILSPEIKAGVYVVAVVLFLWHTLINVGLNTVITIEGVVPGIVTNFFLVPVVYLPLLVEFVLLYFSIQILIPRRIAKTDLGLFFYDPRNMGGFAPIGQLLKRTYYLYTAGLLLYFLMTYGSIIFAKLSQNPYPDPGILGAVFFTLAWLVGVASMAYSMHTIHRVMSSNKEQRIRRLEDRVRSAINNPYDIESAEITDPDTLEDSRRRLEQVRATKEYPTTFTMWSQILVSVILPQALNMVVQIGI